MTLLIVNDAVITADTMKQEIAWKEYGIDCVYEEYQADGARAFRYYRSVPPRWEGKQCRCLPQQSGWELR